MFSSPTNSDFAIRGRIKLVSPLSESRKVLHVSIAGTLLFSTYCQKTIFPVSQFKGSSHYSVSEGPSEIKSWGSVLGCSLPLILRISGSVFS